MAHQSSFWLTSISWGYPSLIASILQLSDRSSRASCHWPQWSNELLKKQKSVNGWNLKWRSLQLAFFPLVLRSFHSASILLMSERNSTVKHSIMMHYPILRVDVSSWRKSPAMLKEHRGPSNNQANILLKTRHFLLRIPIRVSELHLLSLASRNLCVWLDKNEIMQVMRQLG